mmetsp:Transcript_1004/g.761  ORF Transcript_1004/g.761 Transcript_1004/m.761 type:complete len:148 (+) Transcript_1004:202-645(+)
MSKNNDLISSHQLIDSEDPIVIFDSGKIDQDFILSFANAVQDFNPIHCNHKFAISKGLPNTAIHGIMSISFIEHALQCIFGTEWIVSSIEGRFINMLYVGQSIKGWCRIIQLAEHNAIFKMKVKFWVKADNDVRVLVGKSELIRRDK